MAAIVATWAMTHASVIGQIRPQAVWKQREIAVLADSALGEVALES
jgi:hypothetical protein